jgi:hypothetical protein
MGKGVLDGFPKCGSMPFSQSGGGAFHSIDSIAVSMFPQYGP